MNTLANGLCQAKHHEDVLSVQEAELAMLLRLGASEDNMLILQNNLANTYEHLGRFEEALRMRKAIYSGRLKILGEDHSETISAAYNYANSLGRQEHFEECKSLLLKVMPVMRRVLGESDETTLRMMWSYAAVLINNPSATLDDIREAVSTLEDAGRIARRVLGGAHPLVLDIDRALEASRAGLRARETPSGSA